MHHIYPTVLFVVHLQYILLQILSFSLSFSMRTYTGGSQILFGCNLRKEKQVTTTHSFYFIWHNKKRSISGWRFRIRTTGLIELLGRKAICRARGSLLLTSDGMEL
ncbi:hypothetical protein CI102_5602 [Trichoderma harzianum]|uniref:Uncharacterized protein n=1 Tax=Trichoderma harzianum CBS 226.95 TaxID=983964 RepID=A0A2T4AAM2_TRIHA|nr:hypothetical protein M431DRAFT_450370 [Trichoderma harzianum CBS 226.95]PKK50259.1 hypothetical protein CI102_5602 [Trichoderma harzianum]PTB54121.1 hypothetical protein M431DRAFT_450370 [Trichoderma harzianum CBS 226.95]